MLFSDQETMHWIKIDGKSPASRFLHSDKPYNNICCYHPICVLAFGKLNSKGANAIRPVPHIELREIHPRKYNAASQTTSCELLETRLKEEARRKSTDSLHLSGQPSSHCQDCEALKGRERSEQSLISNSYYKTPYETISEVFETKMSANL